MATSWYDPSKWNLGNPLAGVNSFQGSNFVAPDAALTAANGLIGGSSDAGGMGGPVNDPNAGAATLQDASGTSHRLTQNPEGTYSYTDTFNNPSGKGTHDQVRVNYTYDPKTGQVTPTAATPYYSAGDWTDYGREMAINSALIAAGGYGAGSLAAGAGLGAAAPAATTAAETGGGLLGSSAGMSSANLAVLHGAAGYGAATAGEAGFAGLGATTAGGAAGLSAAEVAALPGAYGAGAAALPAATAPAAATAGGITPAQAATGATTAAGSGAGAGGGAGASAGSGGLLSSAGQLIPGVSNGQLLSTAGGLIGAAAGAAGAKGGLNSATTTNQNTVDPRVAQYVYGPNGNSGLLGNVNNLMNSQLATGGLNATQTQGLNMQLSALQDPAYAAGLQQMRSAGAGLLGAAPAGNPYTAGASPAGAQGMQAAPQQQMPPGWQPMQTQLNQPRQMTGLLGNVRPMAQ